MTGALRPATTTARLVFLAIYCGTASGFLLPSAFWRSNFVKPCSRTSTGAPWYPCPTEQATSNTVPTMLIDNNAGEQPQQGEELRRQERGEHTTVTTPVLPQTLGNGRYVVRSVFGTGSTASTYRCTTLLPPPPQQAQQDQERQEEGAIKERLDSSLGFVSCLPPPPSYTAVIPLVLLCPSSDAHYEYKPTHGLSAFPVQKRTSDCQRCHTCYQPAGRNARGRARRRRGGCREGAETA